MARRYFTIGVILLLLGLQLRAVQSYVLTPKASQFIETKIKTAGMQETPSYNLTASLENPLYSAGPFPKKTLSPPRWIGWALLSVGGVLVIHGYSLSRQQG